MTTHDDPSGVACEYSGGDGVQHEQCRVIDRWGTPSTPRLRPVPGSVETTRVNSFNDRDLAWRAVADGGKAGRLPLRALEPTVHLADGSPFLTWEQPARHRRTYYVSQGSPAASDENDGSSRAPWRTIGRAAGTLMPGDRVIVGRGVYREWVRPERGGAGPDEMITYEAGEPDTIISGAEIVHGPWRPSVYRGVPDPGSWTTNLPDELFGSYHPFRLANVEDVRGAVPRTVTWAKGRPGVTGCDDPRGMVHQDGRRLTLAQGDAPLEPGQYRVDASDSSPVVLHLKPFDGVDPTESLIEVTVRPYAFAPHARGLGFIRVAGFTVEQVANCLPMPLEGAISTMQGHHWIIERNTIRRINGLGLDYGRFKSYMPREVDAGDPIDAGIGHVIRGNTFVDCGLDSMMGMGLIGGLVEDNTAIGTGRHRVFITENAGYKPHFTKHCLIRRNTVVNTLCGDGFWIDHSNVNLRFTENVAVSSMRCGIYLEANFEPVLVDRNVTVLSGGPGLQIRGAPRSVVRANLFIGGGSLEPFGEVPAGIPADRSTVRLDRNAEPLFIGDQSGRELVIEDPAVTGRAQDILIEGNVFYGFGKPPTFRVARLEAWREDAFRSVRNLWIEPPDREPFDLLRWQRGAPPPDAVERPVIDHEWHQPGQGLEDRAITARLIVEERGDAVILRFDPPLPDGFDAVVPVQGIALRSLSGLLSG